MIKELAEYFEKKIICLGENTEEYITFSVLIQREITEINKNREKKLKKPYSSG